MIKAVFFDIGETLINETRLWSLFADWVGVPHMTMFGVLGGLISEGRDHRELLDILRPDLAWRDAVSSFSTQVGNAFLPQDLYPDAIPALGMLKREGYFVGIAGNQPAEREKDLLEMNLPADLIATSGGWGCRSRPRRFSNESCRKPSALQKRSRMSETASITMSCLPPLQVLPPFISFGDRGDIFNATGPQRPRPEPRSTPLVNSSRS